MSSCADGCSKALADDYSHTFNSLLRNKTPIPRRMEEETAAVNIMSAVISPFKMLEGLLLISSGALLSVIPCTVCQIKTKHTGNDVYLKSLWPTFKYPTVLECERCQPIELLPCSFRDEVIILPKNSQSKEMQVIETIGYSHGCIIGDISGDPIPENKEYYIKSTLTGYQCASSGVGKIIDAYKRVFCCPIAMKHYACSTS